MKPIEEVFEGTSYWDYKPLLESMGHEIVLQVDDQDYQGDSRLLLKDGDRYGLLIFGWGSCSGCDALQACDTLRQVDGLRRELYDSIIWKDSAAGMLSFIRDRDWLAQYSWHADETKEFVAKAVTMLEGKA